MKLNIGLNWNFDVEDMKEWLITVAEIPEDKITMKDIVEAAKHFVMMELEDVTEEDLKVRGVI